MEKHTVNPFDPIRASYKHLASRFIDRNETVNVSPAWKATLAAVVVGMSLSMSPAHAELGPNMALGSANYVANMEMFANDRAKAALEGEGRVVTIAGGSIENHSMKQVEMPDGTKIWLNREGKPHDLITIPAVQYPDGSFEHYDNGKLTTAPGSTLAAIHKDRETHIKDGAVLIYVAPKAKATSALKF